jgi:hypothetical protein
MNDLWPNDLAELGDLGSPVTILREQASVLGQHTSNLVIADVESSQRGDGTLQHAFFLIAPALDSYRYQLFYVVHDIGFYPLELYSPVFTPMGLRVEDEAEFVERLRTIFSDQSALRMVRGS